MKGSDSLLITIHTTARLDSSTPTCSTRAPSVTSFPLERPWSPLSGEPGGLRLRSSSPKHLPYETCSVGSPLSSSRERFTDQLHPGCFPPPRSALVSIRTPRAGSCLHNRSRKPLWLTTIDLMVLGYANSSAPLSPVGSCPLTRGRHHRLSHRSSKRSVCFPEPFVAAAPPEVSTFGKNEG